MNLLLLAISISAPLSAAPSVETSTRPVARSIEQENPFTMSYLLAPDGKTSVRLDYRIRWDFDSFRKIPNNVSLALRDPVRTIRRTGADIYDGATIGLYGLRLRPNRAWRPRFEEDAGPAGGGAGKPGGGSTAARRRRLSLTPIVDDLRREALRGLERSLITESVDYAVPRLKPFSFDEKRAFVEDLDRTRKIWGLGE